LSHGNREASHARADNGMLLAFHGEMTEKTNTSAQQQAQRGAAKVLDSKRDAVKTGLERAGLTADDVEASLLNQQQTTVPHSDKPAPKR
jgi:hypothetical protein